jgi:hypothetical protein
LAQLHHPLFNVRKENEMNNPFSQQMVKMRFPAGSAGMLTIEGFLLTADKTGCIEIPKNLVKAAESHGLTVV